MNSRLNGRNRHTRYRTRIEPRGKIAKPETPTIALCLILLCALVFGGGGSPAEMAELVVQLGVIGIVAWMAFATGKTDHVSVGVLKRDWILAAPALALVVIYFLQLVPLPPSIWSGLPGRGPLQLNLKVFGETPWLPLSIAPAHTIAALLSLIPPFAAYAVASVSGRDAAPWVMRTLALFGMMTVTLQMLQTTGSFFLYNLKDSFVFTNGFQANRNSQGDVLAILMVALAMRRRGTWSKRGFTAQQLALACGLMIAAVLTGSRAGMLMTGAMFLIVVFRLLRENGASLVRRPALLLGGLTVVAALAAYAASLSPIIMRTVSRFSSGLEGRLDIIWPDAIYTMQQFFPWGAGFGTFVPAFQIYESQETFSELIANRAHSEPLEVLIEGGIPGAIVVGALVIAIFWRAIGEWRHGLGEDERLRALLLLLVCAMMLAHSMVDYPLRSMSLAVLTATLLGLVVADRRRRLDAASKQAAEGLET